MSKGNDQLINRVFSSYSKDLSSGEFTPKPQNNDAKSSKNGSWSDSLSRFVNTNFHALKTGIAHKILVTPYCYSELPKHLKDHY